MKSLLYVSNESFYTKDGILKKKKAQLAVFEKYYDSFLLGYTTDKSHISWLYKGEIQDTARKSSFLRRLNYRFFFQKDCLDFYKRHQFDYVYIRYYRSDLWFILFLRYISKYSKVVIEFPTFPYDGELKNTLRNRLVLLVDSFFRTYLCKYVKKAVTYSDDDTIFGIPSIKTTNGIDLSSINICNFYKNNDGNINLVAVASMSFWHGYDRIIQGLKEYYLKGGTRNIKLYLVGEGKETPYYKKLVQEYGLQDRVIFEGFKEGTALENILGKCNIAISSLGLHRLGLKTASTLKSREYFAQGFPVISATSLDFIEDESKYILKVPSDESVIDIEKIIGFTDQIYPVGGYDLEALINNIRGYVIDKCDMETTLKEILEYMNE